MGKLRLFALLIPALIASQAFGVIFGNIKIDGNTISSLNTNGDVTVDANGTGRLILSDGTANTVPYLDGSKRLQSSAVTPTELGYLTGVTGGIQTQLDAKALATDLSTHESDTTSVHGISDTADLLTTTNTKTVSNKTLTSPIIDVANLTEQGATPATPSAGTKKFYAKNDGKLYTLDSSGAEVEVGSGAGGGSTNVLDNPSFEDAAIGSPWVDTNADCAINSTDYVDDGLSAAQSAECTLSSVNGSVLTQAKTIVAGGLNYEMGAFVKTSMTTVQVCSYVNSVQQQCVNVPSTNQWAYVYATGVTSAGQSAQLEVRTSSSSSGTILIDSAYMGVNRNIGTVAQSVYSATVSSAGVVSNESPSDFINGNCGITSTSTFDCTFVSGFFKSTANCTATSVHGSGRLIGILAQSASAITTRTFDDTGSNVATAWNLTCQKATAEAQAVVRADQTDYGPTAYTPTLGAGFGTTSNVSFFHERKGKWLHVYGTFTAGTVAASAATITLPGSLAIDSALIPLSNTSANPGHMVGNYEQNEAVANTRGVMVTATGTSTTLVYFGSSEVNNSSAITPGLGNTVTANSTVMSVDFWVPIAGWQENGKAPQLVNSVVSSYEGVLRVCSGDVSNNGTATVRQFGDCVSSVNRSSTGKVEVTFKSGYFSDEPICTCSAQYNTGTSIMICGISSSPSSSSSLVSFETVNGSLTLTDRKFHFSCQGPR